MQACRKDTLHQALSTAPLGKALASLAENGSAPIDAAESFFTRPAPAAATPDYRSFWQGGRRLPSEIEPARPPAVSGILVKKGGDFPAFWEPEGSFTAVMEELYRRVREKNRDVL
jgi:uncharacterized Zn finger protein